ncbi:histidine kinase [Saccharomonospora sp. NPDC006951]
MLIVVVLAALAVGPRLELPGWPAVVMFTVQVVHCLPATRRLRGWWTLAIQVAVFPWAGLPGFLAGSILLIVRGRVRWVAFAAVVIAAGLMNTGTVYDCANAIGNTISHGLVIFALTRLDELRARLHETRGRVAEESVAREREQVSGELERSIGNALSEIITLARNGEPARIGTLAAETARRVRRPPEPVRIEEPDDLTPRLMVPIMITVHVVYLVVAALFVAGAPAPLFAGYVLLIAAVVGLQLYHSLPRPGSRLPLAWTLPAETALAVVPLFLPGPPHSQLVGLAAGAVLISLPSRFSWPLAAFLLLATSFVLGIRGVAPYELLAMTLDTAVLAVIFYGIAETTKVVGQVREARRQLAEIAVTRERRRIAQDVHDLLGYGITAITIKAELAAKAPGAAGPELEEIATIARRSLADLVAVPDDSADVSFAEELESASDVLRAAGTVARFDLGHGVLPARVDALLATVLREAVTNVLRHSKAGVCVVETEQTRDEVVLRVANDRVLRREEESGPGNGIANLSARCSALGGTFETHPHDDNFEIVVRQPLHD